MEIGAPALNKFKITLHIITITIIGLILPAYCQAAEVSLFLQQTPEAGGSVSPVVGVYNYAARSEVEITATPNEGYEFAYWLGDVGDPVSASTVVLLDSPKIIIAVFQKTDNIATQNGISGGGGGAGSSGAGGGLVRSAVDLSLPSGISPASRPSKPQKINTNTYAISGGKQAVVPEPTTVMLLGLGSTIAVLVRRKNHRNI